MNDRSMHRAPHFAQRASLLPISCPFIPAILKAGSVLAEELEHSTSHILYPICHACRTLTYSDVHCATAGLLLPLLHPICATKKVLLSTIDTAAHTAAAAWGLLLGSHLVYSKGVSRRPSMIRHRTYLLKLEHCPLPLHLHY